MSSEFTDATGTPYISAASAAGSDAGATGAPALLPPLGAAGAAAWAPAGLAGAAPPPAPPAHAASSATARTVGNDQQRRLDISVSFVGARIRAAVGLARGRYTIRRRALPRLAWAERVPSAR